MSCPSTLPVSREGQLGIPTRPVTLHDVIRDCGGTSAVAAELKLSVQSVYGWVRQGHIPFSDLQGKTDYSDKIAQLQRVGTLTSVEIRRLGLRL